MEKRDDPSNPSGAYSRMKPAWEMIEDILEGPAAIRAKKTAYLPKYEREAQAEYDRRVKQAPFSAVFEDALNNLTAKPFAKDITLRDGASQRIKDLCEDIDGRGNNLTAFCRPVFRCGVAFGCHAILVDNTGRGEARTRAEEAAANVRPYCVSIEADDIIALDSAFVGGREQIYHVRIKEGVVRRDGYEEVSVERIREFNREPTYGPKGNIVALGPPTWVLHEERKGVDGKARTWERIDEGVFAPLTEIPLAVLWTGDRDGPQEVRPPLYALADKQIELYRAQAREDEILTYAGSPMLASRGIQAPKAGETVAVGPKSILYAPADGGWEYVQPDADNLRQIREHVASVLAEASRLGMQPLLPKSGGVTATATAIEGANAHSAVQAWALGLKDALEQALAFMSKWLNEEPSAEVAVHTDFLAGTMSQPGLDALHKARLAKEISRRTYLEGLVRFGVLPGDFDIEADEELIAEEMAGLEPEVPADPSDPGNENTPPIAA
ncbi:portal protein [Synechococcus phage Ssp-JY42]|nr:portal protein [Synechococcus phage Yong-M4-211]